MWFGPSIPMIFAPVILSHSPTDIEISSKESIRYPGELLQRLSALPMLAEGRRNRPRHDRASRRMRIYSLLRVCDARGSGFLQSAVNMLTLSICAAFRTDLPVIPLNPGNFIDIGIKQAAGHRFQVALNDPFAVTRYDCDFSSLTAHLSSFSNSFVMCSRWKFFSTSRKT